jgi:hypothetical protein
MSSSSSMSMYQASVPIFIHLLGNLSVILAKGEAYAEIKRIDPSVLVNARLAPDMYSLARQVQTATDAAKGCVARLAGIEVPSYADTEATFDELQARIAKTVAFIQSARAEQIDGSEERTITLKTGGQERKLKAQHYLVTLALPNFHFHVATAYAILRLNGVELDETDFLGSAT